MSCANPNTSALKSLCACESAANNLADSVATYQAQVIAYTNSCTNYNNSWNTYQTEHSNWESKKSQKLSDLTNEIKTWNSCVDGNINCGSHQHDNWCSDDIGQSGWYQTGCTKSDCGVYRKGTCARTNDRITSDLNSWLVSNAEPQPPTGGTGGTCTPCSTCNPPSNNNLQCCSQVFSELSAGKNITIDAAQNCSQEIKQQIAAAVIPNPTTVPPITSTQVPTTQVPTTQVPTTQVPTTQVPTTQIPTTTILRGPLGLTTRQLAIGVFSIGVILFFFFILVVTYIFTIE